MPDQSEGGLRQVDFRPRLGPVASAKDLGRTPLRKFGRVELAQIAPDPQQPRTDFDEQEIGRLAASIQRTGQLHPIRVRWDDTFEKWMIVSGERRYRATLAAGLTHIECYFHDDGITESEIREQQLVENLLRQDLRPLEEARGYAALMELNGWNAKQVADALCVSTSKVSRALALLDLPEDIQQQVEAGALPRISAYELAKLGNQASQRALAEQAAAEGLTHKQTSQAVRQRRGTKPAKPRGIRQVFNTDTGIKLTVTANRKGNYHEIAQALEQALAEVHLRIDNNVQLL